MASNRKPRIAKARNINELMDIVSEISADFKKDTANVDELLKSLSSYLKPSSKTLKFQTSASGDIVFDMSKVSAPKIKTSGPVALKLTKFVRPPKEAVLKNNEILRKLYSKLSDLDDVSAVLAQDFGSDAKRRRAEMAIDSLYAEIQKAVKEAFIALNSIAEKHVPSEFAQMGIATLDTVKRALEGSSHADIDQQLYLSLQDSNLVYSLYTEIDSLKDSKGYVYSEFYVVLTGVISSTGHIEYHLNVLPSFKIPGEYLIGKTVDSLKSLEIRTSLLLASNDISVHMGKKPLPMSADIASVSMKHIKEVLSASVKDDTLTLALKPGIKDVNSVIVQVTPILNRLAGINSKSKSIFKHKVVTKGSSTYLSYVLTPIGGDESDTALTAENLSLLTEALGLTATDVKAIKASLRGRL